MRQPANAPGLPDPHGTACAAEARAGSGPGRSDGTRRYKPVSPAHRAALARLVEAGRMIRRADGGYGNDAETLMPNAIAVDLKNRRFAAAGFSKDLVPTERGKKLLRETQS
jgi:hypothetical protein